MLEVKRYKGKIVYRQVNSRTIYYLDQLKDSSIVDPINSDDLSSDLSLDNWIMSRHMSDYLLSNYNLSIEEYYKLVVYGDKDYIVTCKNPDCNNVPRFVRLAYGYAEHCCGSCAALTQWRDEQFLSKINEIHSSDEYRKLQSDNQLRIWNDPDYRSAMSEIHIKAQSDETYKARVSESMKLVWSELEYYYEQSAKIAKGTAYAKYGHLNTLNIYLAIYKDCIKIGITMHPNEREYKLTQVKDHLLSINFYESSVNKIIECEYNIKMKFKDSSLVMINKCSSIATEYFESTRLDDIKNYIINSI